MRIESDLRERGSINLGQQAQLKSHKLIQECMRIGQVLWQVLRGQLKTIREAYGWQGWFLAQIVQAALHLIREFVVSAQCRCEEIRRCCC